MQEYLIAFAVGGTICALSQLLIFFMLCAKNADFFSIVSVSSRIA